MTKYHGNVGRWGASQDVSFSTAAAATAQAVGPGITRVRIVGSIECRVRVGKNATATTSDTLLPPASPEYVIVSPGEVVSAIGGASGTLNVTEVD